VLRIQLSTIASAVYNGGIFNCFRLQVVLPVKAFSMIGRTLGHYCILEKIGQGGMGEVFLADDTSLHRKVALKFLHPDMQRDETAHKRFIREARSAAALDHPFICHINEVAESDGQDFIVMEYVDGQSVKDRLAQGLLPLEDALQITIEVSEALEAAHAKGIIHRDIKPANIMLTQTGHAKVMDFGLAKQVVPPGVTGSAEETITALTSDGSMVGTLAYMSPEQLRSQGADARSDIWALGVTLYEMVSGMWPFRGQSGFELSSAILNQAPRPLPSQVPAELGTVIERCLEKEAGKRYQQAGDVRVALEAIQAGTVAPWVSWRYRLGRHRWLMLAAVLVILAALLVGLNVAGLRGRLSGGGRSRAVRLAVLPFVNLSGDVEQEYLSDGMTQEMISQLGGLHPTSLSVIARTSVMRYKKSDKPVDEVGRELNVDYILEGSARREGRRIRITAELIQVRDQAQLWAETYERDMAGVMALQSEVAKKVAGSLALKLLPAEQARLATVLQVNPEAYEAYLKGLQQWYKLTRAGVDAALQYFESALEKDPNYAPAHMGVSLVWVGRAQYGWVARAEALPLMKAAALKAVELNDAIAETHYALALTRAWYEWDWAGAEPEFKRAIEINPSFPDARAYYAHFLMHMRRPKEALAQMAQALELDPFNALFQSLYARELTNFGQYDAAITQARNVLGVVPGHPTASGTLTDAFWYRGMKQEAIVEWKAQRNLRGEQQGTEAFDRGYREGGYPEGWKRYAEYRATGFPESHTGAMAIVQAYVKAGDYSLVLEWLERAFEVRDPNLPYAFIGPGFEAIRSDPRFQALRRKMNLPE
jgi:TolB-like protein/tRNA A-37 threonylcarbamoyl transferase component Bud32/Tfp pilus assembly protein PilF